MAKKKLATPDDLPITAPPIDTKFDQVWDPTGNNPATDEPAAEQHDAHVLDWRAQQSTKPPAGDDPDLQEFLTAVRDGMDPDSELVVINPETTP